MLTDEALILHAQAGDSEALEQLIARHEKTIYNIALRTIGSRDDAMDLAQEAIIKIVRSIKGFKRGSTFGVWAYRITVNACLDELRKRKKHKAISLDAYLEAGGSEPLETSASPDAELLRGDLRRILERAIASLPEEYRAALILRDITGLSYTEISDVLRISLGTVKSRINRARNILKGNLPDALEQLT